MADVFVSYRRSDRRTANKMERLLVSARVSVWFDKELKGGDTFVDRINEELELANIVVAIWSADASESKFVRGEMLRAFNLDKLLVVRIDDTPLPAPYDSLQTLDWRKVADRQSFASTVRNRMNRSSSKESTRKYQPPHDRVWNQIEKSIDCGDYRDYVHHFRETEQGFEASRRIRQLEKWAQLEDEMALKEFAIVAFPALSLEIRRRLGLVEDDLAAEAALDVTDVHMDEKFDGAIATYLSLDIRAAAEPLFSSARMESTFDRIALTSAYDEASVADGLTPAMSSWYATYVAPLRQPAILQAEQVSTEPTSANQLSGLLLPRKLDQLKYHLMARRKEIISRFRNENEALIREREEAQIEYERMRAEEFGRDAKVPNRYFVWGVLLPLIMLPQALLNFEIFRQVPFIGSNLQALGVTILVGVGLSVAANLVGRFVRQFNFYTRTDNNYVGWPLWVLGTLLLALTLSIVGYARYYYSISTVEQSVIQGWTLSNLILQVASFLMGNIVVFFLGVGINFMLYDKNPEFADAARKLRMRAKQFEKARHSAIIIPLTEADKAHDDREKAAINAELQMRMHPDYKRISALIAAIEAKDRVIQTVLVEYKSRLSKLVQQSQSKVRYEKYDLRRNPSGEPIQVSSADFMEMTPRLSWYP
ncbi:toll/interleukin-1 receptor domain-containing protein [Hyphomonas sp. WL0036]|uniref:toll/interleukin-1 receptor domain-containing protein n=1 Tax=Hyphomonas sediminis TaxID=2866160 RepID=UPI001C80CF2E|nr:toll/interleukin-1 receptor domain-containing protein [Hyphomonas sediminis]MBY9068223.1 toll/interleukin-1 receptor domain-containing protein [Hyphomonas sediminis]